MREALILIHEYLILKALILKADIQLNKSVQNTKIGSNLVQKGELCDQFWITLCIVYELLRITLFKSLFKLNLFEKCIKQLQINLH